MSVTLNQVISFKKFNEQLFNKVATMSYCFRLFLFFVFLLATGNVYSATTTWSGATSTAWALASNWVGNNVPGNGDNVLIPGGLTKYPVVTANASFKNLTVNSSGAGASVTVTAGVFNAADIVVAAGGTLIISGGSIGASEIVINGLFTMTGGNVTNSGTLIINSGGITNQSAGLIYMNSNSTSNPKDDLQILAGGVYNQTGGTISFKDFLAGAGTFNQTSSTALVTIARNWQMGAGSNFNSTAGTLQFTGNGSASNFSAGTRQFTNVIINSGINPGFSLAPGSTITISGNFTNNNAALVNSSNVTFIFNGSGNQSASSATTGTGTIFGNLQVNKTGGLLSLLTNCHVAGDLTISAGSFDLVTFMSNRSTAGGVLTISSGATLLLRGITGGQSGSNFPLNFSATNLAVASTVVYNGTNQTVASIPYGNLTISSGSGSVTKTFPATTLNISGNLTSLTGAGTGVNFTAAGIINIGGNFTIGVNTSFTGSTYAHSLGGNFTNSGTYTNTGNKIIFNGTGTQIISSPGTFNKIAVNKTSGIVNIASDLIITDSLVFLKGNIRTGAFKIIKNTGPVTGSAQATGWVFGKLQKPVPAGSGVSLTFQIGDSLVYAPVSMTLGTVSTAGSLVVSSTGTDHPSISGSVLNSIRTVNRYWSCSNSGINYSNGTFTFNWATSDLDPGCLTADFNVGQYTGTWDTATVILPTANSIQATGIALFGDFVVGEICLSSNIGKWTGVSNNLWSSPDNWQCGILPGSSTNVVIASGAPNYPILSSGTQSLNNITVQAGATFTINGATLQIAGSFSGSGTIDANGAGIVMNGTTAQLIPAGIFTSATIKDLTVNNTSGVTITGNLNVTGVLKAAQGNLNTGGNLTLVSGPTQTALIDGTGNGSVVGNLNMQRYLPSGYGYKYFSSPFQSSTVNEFSDDLDLLATFPTFYKYDENLPSSGWVNYTSPSGTLMPLRGYAANFGSASSSKIVDITGVVNNGNQTISLTNNNRPFTLGFNLAGNPYPSPVNWDATAGWSRANIDNAIYYFDASTTDMYGGVYSSYINGVSSNGIATSLIPAMQGFFVHVSDGSYPVGATLGINNSARTNDLQPFFHRTSQVDYPLIRLEMFGASGMNNKDALVVYFDEQSTSSFNTDKDALKLMNTDDAFPNFYSLSSEGKRLSINALNLDGNSPVYIPLGIKSANSGKFHFSISELSLVPDSFNIYLADKHLHINYDLRKHSVYETNIESGQNESRFALIMTTDILAPIEDTEDFGVYSAGNNIYVFIDLEPGEVGKLTISNMQGQILFRNEYKNSDQFNIQNNFNSGIYIVSFQSNKSLFSKKIFLKAE